MAGWSITTWSLIGATTTPAVSGANAVLSGNAVYLEFDDTNAGGQNFRWNDLNKQFYVTWYNGTAWVDLGGFTDPTTGILYWNLANCGIQLTGQATGPQNVFEQFVGTEANARFQWDTNGKLQWGPGGATAVDTTLQRIAAGILQTSTLRGTAAPSNVADLTRKDYVDTQVATAVPLAGGTMTGLLILSADPTAAKGAATKQYVDASGTGATTFATGAVLFGQNTKVPAVDTSNFFWDSTNHRLGLGNNAPATLLDLATGTITLRQTTANYSLTWANPAAARAISIPDPLGTDVFVFAAMTQTLTNKTLTAPAISAPVLSGTATGTYTLAGTPTITAPAISAVVLSGDINVPNLVALGGGAAPTVGTIGGSGPATAGQNGWLQFKDAGGNKFWVPAWK